MIVVVYAPQEAKEKRMLWDYLAHVSNQWVGKLVMMGDFNEIMRKISSWWNIDYSDVNSYEEWRVWLVSIRIQSKLKGVLEDVYYDLWWYMWNFRNKLLFDKKIPEKALIFDNLVSSSFYWCKFRCKASFKWDDWLKNPYIVLV
ncbi:RNA-directed DNA polymerase, eukaryota [Tanacetum coccineum]